jgi:hypothetical protein
MNQLSHTAHNALHALATCHQTCHSMAMVHCLELGGDHARPQHLRLMQDCADICAVTADFIGRKSQFHTQISAFCVQICETCAEACEKLGRMEACVTACRECAARCRDVARSGQAAALNAGAAHPPT